MVSVTVTKLPPGPENNIPLVGRLYSIYCVDFVYFIKWSKHSWKYVYSLKAVDEFRTLIASVTYVMLTKISINEEEGSIKGTLLIGEKMIDFWLTGHHDESCLDIWQRFFIPACV